MALPSQKDGQFASYNIFGEGEGHRNQGDGTKWMRLGSSGFLLFFSEFSFFKAILGLTLLYSSCLRILDHLEIE